MKCTYFLKIFIPPFCLYRTMELMKFYILFNPSFSAIQLLKDKAPGTFVVRDSNSFPGAFGLALKVATVPANVQTKSTGDPSVDLVRHFLIEPTPKGVRLRGCNNEPVFGIYSE